MIVLMSGFGYSGSSALNDLLLEMEGFVNAQDELRFIVDPDGFICTETLLREAWNPFVCDMAIRRLKELMERLSKHKAWPYYNQCHDTNISPLFSRAAEELIANLSDITFQGMWLGINDPFEYRRRHIKKWTSGLIDMDHKKEMFFCRPDKDFRALAKKFLTTILKEYEGQHLLLDEGYASMNPAAALAYFDKAKVLISQRDPRDVYCEIIRKNARFIPHDPEQFVLWYKAVRDRYKSTAGKTPDALTVNFEDLILNYDTTVRTIMEFLEIPQESHTMKKQRLIPENSAKNIGKWKQFPDQTVMKYLGDQLAT